MARIQVLWRVQRLVVGLLLGAISLTGPRVSESATWQDDPGDRTLMRSLVQTCNEHEWCTPSYWAWELQLAIHQRNKGLARGIAHRLGRMQQPNGSWGLGTDWGQAEYDFKRRTARDAESWEVAEVGMALVDYDKAFSDHSARSDARHAARYLKRRVVTVRGRPYLAHMPECNNVLQPHSTVASALLLDQFPGNRRLASRLRRSGKAMRGRRIVPQAGPASLRNARWGISINDYERVQVGLYLARLGDPQGPRMLRRFAPTRHVSFPRTRAYLVLAETIRGRHQRAGRQARAAIGFTPLRGYDYALLDWVRAHDGDHRSPLWAPTPNPPLTLNSSRP